MAYQTGRQISVALKEESEFGVLPGATGSTAFRANSGTLGLSKAAIQSGENRSDGMMTRGRHGSKSVSGQYLADLSIGTFDALIEAGFRGTWSSVVTVDDTAMSSDTIAVSSNVVTFTGGGGNALTEGVRVGDVHRWTSGLNAGDLNKNLRVTAATASSITYADTLTDVAGPVSSYSFTIPKTLLQGITPRSFTFEEYETDIDDSEVFTGVRVGSLSFALQPDGNCILTVGLVGQDMQVMEDGSSPYFTNPTSTTTIAMTAVEASIRLGTEDLVDLSSLTLEINLNAAGVPVVGSLVTPDVFTNLAAVTGSATTLRKDPERVKNFLDEDQLSLHLLLTENETAPQDFFSLFVGNLTLSSATKSELGSDNARTQDLQLMIGKDERGGAYQPSMVVAQTSST